jgi:hypothetical protein
MLDTSVISADIARLVQNSPQHKVLGSELAVLLKRGYPSFRAEDFGCRNLRDFVRRYVKNVFEDGKRGTDVMYSAAVLPAVSDASSRQQEFTTISEPPSAVGARQVQPDKAIWKTFVSPNAPYKLYANKSTGELKVLSVAQAPPGEFWVSVPPCAAETHEKIAKEFLDGLGDEAAKVQLTKILGLNSWWEHFFFSARNFGVERQWSAFRRRRLHEEFQGTLDRLSIPRIPVADRGEPARQFIPIGGGGVQSDDSELKKLLIAVIRRMPDSELRLLSLPAGYFADATGEK